MDSEYLCDDWPKMPDGSDFDGCKLLTLVDSGSSPFHGVWDVRLLIRDVEEILSTQVIDIPYVHEGANYYGFHIKLSNRPDILARFSRADVNMPNYASFPLGRLVRDVKFEAAVYELLHSVPGILASHLLYHRTPVQHVPPRPDPPQDIAGRRLFLFEKPEETSAWCYLSPENKIFLLTQAARIRVSLFNYDLPFDFASFWFLDRIFEKKPESLPIPLAPTREFCVALFTSKIEATIRNTGDVIGWEWDNQIVGPLAAQAKQSLLRLIPHIIPTDSDEASLCRLVLEHGDFGVHNMSITVDANGQLFVTSVYDWEMGCIVPAFLSDPKMAAYDVDLVTDENVAAAITRLPDEYTPDEHAEYMTWARHYLKTLFDQAPGYEHAIRAGKDARHLWFALRDWRGEDPEGFFGDLGTWAEKRMKELGVDGATG